MSELTKQGQAIYNAVVKHWKEHDLSPDVRTVMRMSGASSTSVVAYWYDKLEEMGLLEFGETGSGTRKPKRPRERDDDPG